MKVVWGQYKELSFLKFVRNTDIICLNSRNEVETLTCNKTNDMLYSGGDLHGEEQNARVHERN